MAYAKSVMLADTPPFQAARIAREGPRHPEETSTSALTAMLAKSQVMAQVRIALMRALLVIHVHPVNTVCSQVRPASNAKKGSTRADLPQLAPAAMPEKLHLPTEPLSVTIVGKANTLQEEPSNAAIASPEKLVAPVQRRAQNA
jgi:hypothetical protein